MNNLKDVVGEYVERVWNQTDMKALIELTTNNFTYRLGNQPPRSREMMKEFLESVRFAFPDWKVEILDVISESSLTAIRWEGAAIHEGDFNGIPPTHKKIFVSGMNFYKITNGKIEVEWEQTDSLGMLMQMRKFQI